MNKATIESIEWHRDQLFKLLEDDDLYKEEGSIHSVKTELNEIVEKAKKRVWVKPTATKKGHYREQEVGRKESDVITVTPKIISVLEREAKHQFESAQRDTDVGMAHGIRKILESVKNGTMPTSKAKELLKESVRISDEAKNDFDVGHAHGIKFALKEIGLKW